MTGATPPVFDLQGAKELERTLEQLGKTFTRRVLRKALRRAAQPVLAEARRLAPVGDTVGKKKLVRTIVIRDKLTRAQKRHARRGIPPGAVTMFVGSTSPKAHLVEFGHLLVRGTGDDREVIGHVAAHPFMRPAWERNKGRVLALFRQVLWEEILATIAKEADKAEAGKPSRTARRVFGRAAR